MKIKIPPINDSIPYRGLYAVDFGDHSGVGFTAEEVAELLDSEHFSHIQVYKIHNAYPDGRMELVGVRNDLFGLEMGTFFYAPDSETAEREYRQLIDLAIRLSPPTRAKVHLARYSDGQHVTALIYPAEYNDEFSRWLIDGDYCTSGAVEGGIEAFQRYINQSPDILQRHQLWSRSPIEHLSGQQLLEATNRVFVR